MASGNFGSVKRCISFGVNGTSHAATTDHAQPIRGTPPPHSALDEIIREFGCAVSNADLATLFKNCFSNTLSTTVSFEESESGADTFVITGDIEAMWLRDSTAQVWCYLGLATENSQIRRVLAGVINRHTDCILIDPYANAFNREASGGQWQSDHTRMVPEVYERKWEIDSLCYPIRLAHGYWRATGDANLFGERWIAAMRLVVQTFREQQRKRGMHGPYRFQRTTCEAMDSLPIRGAGNPVAPAGLICSAFRPSDDATIFPFLIPSNLFAVVSLRQLAAILEGIHADPDLAQECQQLAAEVERAVAAHGTHEHPKYGLIYAYEVDGYGGRVYMDDANVPSLLSLPYLGCCNARRSRVSRHQAICIERGQSVVLQKPRGRGDRQPSHGSGPGVADRNHDARTDEP